MANILKHVDVSDLINIKIVRPNVKRPDLILVDITAIEKGKRVVIDETALQKFNQIITEKAGQFSARDPKASDYIKEFAHKMCSGWHRSGLLIIEDIPEAIEDHYAEMRKKYKGR
jgi:hypothetical protein